MAFLAKHRVVLGGIAIGLLAAIYQLATAPVINAGYVVGVLLASLAIYGTVGGFLIWIVSPKTRKKGDTNA